MRDNSETSIAATGLSAKSSQSFAAVAGRISALTSNLLATAIAMAIALAVGWQLMSWWREKPPTIAATNAADASLAKDSAILPPGVNEHDFLTSSGLIKVQQLTGTPMDAIDAMRTFCRTTSSDGGVPRVVGQGEAAFVKQLVAEQPLEESSGLAVYQPPGQAAMVVAVDRNSQKIVAWSFATPSSDGRWSLYHFRPK